MKDCVYYLVSETIDYIVSLTITFIVVVKGIFRFKYYSLIIFYCSD